MKRHSRITIPPHEEGTRLVDFLARRFSYLEREIWTDELQQGRVLVNGQRAPADAMLCRGDAVAYFPTESREPPVEGAYDVLFEDDAILAVNKPGNLPCHPGGRYFQHTLWAMIKDRHPKDGIYFVHRLDRETSGVVLIAKTSRDASILGRQMAGGDVHKRYVALVDGRFPHGALFAEGALAPDRSSVIRKKMRFFPYPSHEEVPEGAKSCRTCFETLQTGPGLSLVSALPVTGRHHQIRATLLALGYPVVGDKIYGVDETLFIRFIEGRLTEHDRARLRMNRQALHGGDLEFHHPRTGRRLCITAPVPQMFERLLTEAIISDLTC